MKKRPERSSYEKQIFCKDAGIGSNPVRTDVRMLEYPAPGFLCRPCAISNLHNKSFQYSHGFSSDNKSVGGIDSSRRGYSPGCDYANSICVRTRHDGPRTHESCPYGAEAYAINIYGAEAYKSCTHRTETYGTCTHNAEPSG